MNTWKVILATLAIFSAGFVTGALVIKSRTPAERQDPPGWIFQGPDFVQQRFLDRMKKEMELSDDQSKKMEVIFRNSREKMKSWWDIIGPEMKAEIKEVKDKIKCELSAEQWEKFEKLLKEYRRPYPGRTNTDKRPHEHRTTNQPGSMVITN